MMHVVQTRLGVVAQIIVLAGLLLALVGAYQEIGVLQRQNAQLIQTGNANHTETLAKISAVLTAQQHEETVLLTAFCATLRDERAIAAKEGVALGPLLSPKNARGYVDVAGCRVAVLPSP